MYPAELEKYEILTTVLCRTAITNLMTLDLANQLAANFPYMPAEEYLKTAEAMGR